MFSKHDPRAAALRAVHENRATVAGTAYDGRPEFLIDDDPAWGVVNELLDDGYISYDESARLPATVETTDKGKLALTALFGILPVAPAEAPVAPAAAQIAPGQNDSEGDDPDDRSGSSATHQVLVEYDGLDPEDIAFVNDEAFRSILRRNGLQIGFGDEELLDVEDPLTRPDRLWVIDPTSGSGLTVLNDGPCASFMEHPAFIEILQLMDEHLKKTTRTRIFSHLKDYYANSASDGALEVEVTEGHPYYDREYDFTTGNYAEDNTGGPLEPAPGAVTINYFGLGPQCLDFANGKEFRDAVSKHGYEIVVDDNSSNHYDILASGQPAQGYGYLSVVDPATDARLYVLYDDESWSDLESPGFVEILQLMDAYCKEESQSRLFMAEPETDEEEDELDLWVGEDHPFYGLQFDFNTGKYKRA